MLESHEKQKLVIAATAVAGVADYAVAALLIPQWGAAGACIGSGVAQVMAVIILWGVGIHSYNVKLGWVHLAKVATASAAAAVAAFLVASHISSITGVLLGGLVSLAVLLIFVYLLGAIEEQDRARLDMIAAMLPARWSRPVTGLVNMLCRAPRLSPVGKSGVTA